MDAEFNLIPHYTDVESMAQLIEEGITGAIFSDPTNAEIFERASDYFLASKFQQAIPRTMLEDEFAPFFKRRGWPEDEIIVSELVEKLRTKYRRNQAKEILERGAAMITEDPQEAISMLLSEATRVQFNTASRQRSENYSETYFQRLEEYDDRVLNHPERQRGITFGWPEITDFTNGIKKQELAVFAGIPNAGKSWVMNYIALRAAQSGVKTYLANLENTHELCLMRLDCILAGIPFVPYERGQLTTEQRDRLRNAREQIEAMSGNLLIDSPESAEERGAFEIYSRAAIFDAELVVGDQLSWVTPRDYYKGDKTAQMTEVVTDLSNLSKQADIASVWASQLNREAARSSGPPRMHQIALTSTIEQICNWVFTISRNQNQVEEELMELRIVKSRRTALVGWFMDWNLGFTTNLSVREQITDT